MCVKTFYGELQKNKNKTNIKELKKSLNLTKYEYEKKNNSLQILIFLIGKKFSTFIKNITKIYTVVILLYIFNKRMHDIFMLILSIFIFFPIKTANF